MGNLTAVNTVLQHQIERPTGEFLAAIFGPIGSHPPLASYPCACKLALKHANRLEREIAWKISITVRASSLLTTSLRSLTSYPRGGMPPIHMPFFLEAAILSRTRSPMTSRSNWAKDSNTLSVSRPMLVVVLNCWVIDTNDTPQRSKTSTSLAKSDSARVNRSTL